MDFHLQYDSKSPTLVIKKEKSSTYHFQSYAHIQSPLSKSFTVFSTYSIYKSLTSYSGILAKDAAVSIGYGVDIVIIEENPICRCILVNFFQRVTLFLLQTSLYYFQKKEIIFPRASTHLGELPKLLTFRCGSRL